MAIHRKTYNYRLASAETRKALEEPPKRIFVFGNMALFILITGVLISSGFIRYQSNITCRFTIQKTGIATGSTATGQWLAEGFTSVASAENLVPGQLIPVRLDNYPPGKYGYLQCRLVSKQIVTDGQHVRLEMVVDQNGEKLINSFSETRISGTAVIGQEPKTLFERFVNKKN